MKKSALFLLVLICVFNSYDTHAQVSFGGRLGMSFSNWRQTDFDPKLKEGFDAAALIRFPISEIISIKTELHYASKGFQIKNSGFSTSIVKFTYRYLEIPLLINRDFHKNNTTFYVAGGPSIGYLIGGKAKSCIVNVSTAPCESDKLDLNQEGLNRTELGFNLGTGIGFNVGKEDAKFFLDIRYFWGFTDVFEENANFEVGKNQGFLIGFSLDIPVQKNNDSFNY